MGHFINVALMSGETPGEGVQAMGTAIDTGITNFGKVWTNVVSLITSNEVLMIFLVAGLIGTAFRIFKRAKKSVR